MADEGSNIDAAVGFFKALGNCIAALDNPKLGRITSERFLWLLDELISELPTIPGGPDMEPGMQMLRHMLGNHVAKAKDIEMLARRVDEIFNGLDS